MLWLVATPAGKTPTRVVGRYAFYERIAAGGMATVYLGRLCGPAGFAPTVALKCLHDSYANDAEFVRMFLDEARLAARIRHPNVVPVLDVVASIGEVFLVMEYVHGEPLSRLMRIAPEREERVSPPVASAILCGVLHGLHAAHEARDESGKPLGIVHRDVSPQNILVGVDGVARVLDFGVAKATGRAQVTRDGQVKGKMAYMAPEHLTSGEINRQADVYSAAVVLWEVLAGRRLFRAETEGSLVHQVLAAEVEPPSAFNPDVTKALDRVVMRGLARDRGARFRSASEMAVALQEAAPPSPPPTVGQWVSRWADEALSDRERLVAAVSASAPVPEGSAPALSSMRTIPDLSRASELKSQVSSISVSTPVHRERRVRGAWPVVLALSAAAVAVAVTVALLRPHPVTSTSVGSVPPSAPPAVSDAPPSPTDMRPSASAFSLPTSGPSASLSPAPVARPPARRAPAPNCNPPFIRNAEGEKIYKRECLK
jgi:serine/threonine-protein kinase